MIVDPVTVSIALASPIVGFGCAVLRLGTLRILWRAPAPPAPSDPQIASIEHELERVAEDLGGIRSSYPCTG